MIKHIITNFSIIPKMNAEEIKNAMEPVPFEYHGKLPKSLECLHCSNDLVEIKEDQRKELAKILKKQDAIGDKLDQLHKNWRSKWFINCC